MMQLKCPECKHQWEEATNPGEAFVQCPECFAATPLALAQQRPVTPPAAAPEPPVSRPPTAERRPPPRRSPRPPAPRRGTPRRQRLEQAVAPPMSAERPEPRLAPPERSAPAPPGAVADPFAQTGAFDEAPPDPAMADNRAFDPLARTAPPLAAFATSDPLAATGALGSTGLPWDAPQGGHEMAYLKGEELGGYEVTDMLGAGGMGAVFLARQVSLDRDVALKILPRRFEKHPEALARFMREALSAAQLTHHNVVQVYDVGGARDHHFISMEYVRGVSLGDQVRLEGRLSVNDAAGYVLQAARGLMYAHSRGIIHRDIKPDNLLVNEQGVLKIADMGLAKRTFALGQQGEALALTGPMAFSAMELAGAGTELTLANRGLGTPAYMSPEQARDAASVDGRADQYSLGCTLYYLCAGKAPHSGTTAFELINKHLNEPPTPLEAHVDNVPVGFNQMLSRMLEKNPQHRFSGMDEVIHELEAHLGVESEKGAHGVREQHLRTLENAQDAFYAPARAGLRGWVKASFALLTGGGFIALSLNDQSRLAGGLLGLMALTPWFHFIINGVTTRSAIFRHARGVFVEMPLKSWIFTMASGLFSIFALYAVGWLPFWAGFSALAFGIAVLYEWALERPLRGEREQPLADMQKVLRELRLRGVSEEAMQDFVYRFSGAHWEEFFEQLFGYQAMLDARYKWAAADQAHPRKRFATWREPLMRWLNGVEDKRRTARARRELTKVEAQRLRDAGLPEKDAERKAAEEAKRFTQSLELTKAREAAPKRRGEEKSRIEAQPVIVVRRRWGASPAFLYRVLRAALGLAILLACASFQAGGAEGAAKVVETMPRVAASFLEHTYVNWGQGEKPIAAMAGLILFLTAFSGRPWINTLMLFGALLYVAHIPLMGLAPSLTFLTAERILNAAMILSFGGFAWCILGSLFGDKF